MLFKRDEEVHIVKSCPVSKASTGVLEFPPELVAKVSGAVQDSIEWMVLLLGERSADGFHVKVTDFRVPKQRRSGADVKMAEPMEGDGSTVDDAVVGVLHSHHRMGAFFSGTDNNELNPFFKSSIVVAQAKTALGFSYKAEGKVTLPCGSIGKVDFFLKVTGSERWNAVEKHDVDGKAGFGDCDQLVEEVVETETETVTKKVAPAACGLSSEVKSERAFVFGCAGGEQLLGEIRGQSVGYAPDERVFGGGSGQTGGGKPSRKERRRMRRLSARHSGVYSMGSSGAIDACDHGVLLTTDCKQCDADDQRERYTPVDSPTYVGYNRTEAPHLSATGVMMNSKDKCEFDLNGQHKNDKLYLYIAVNKQWRMWLCEECYDWWMEGARETFEEDINQSMDAKRVDDELCLHGVLLDAPCRQCDGDTATSVPSEGAQKWDKVARDVLTAEEYEAAKKERVERMLAEVSEKEARATIVEAGSVAEKEQMAKALQLTERLGIARGNAH